MTKPRSSRMIALAASCLAASVALASADGAVPAASTEADVPRIGFEEFATLRAAEAIVVADVRARVAYERGHIPGAWSVPAGREVRHLERLRAAGKPIVLYCA